MIWIGGSDDGTLAKLLHEHVSYQIFDLFLFLFSLPDEFFIELIHFLLFFDRVFEDEKRLQMFSVEFDEAGVATFFNLISFTGIQAWVEHLFLVSTYFFNCLELIIIAGSKQTLLEETENGAKHDSCEYNKHECSCHDDISIFELFAINFKDESEGDRTSNHTSKPHKNLLLEIQLAVKFANLKED